MKIEVEKIGKNELELILWNEGHTFCNLIVNMALDNPDVEYCSYFIRHPLIPKSRLYILTKKEDPIKILIDTANKIMEITNKIEEKFKVKLDSYGAAGI